MFVVDRMSHPVITIHPDLPLQQAFARMRNEKVRRFPVVDKQGHLVGIVSEKDLMEASPSDVTSLNIYELNYLLHKITVNEIMTKDVITVDVDTPIETAARIMADNKIGGLPVMRDHEVVGIITETDLFKIFLELVGAREYGLRLTTLVLDKPGELAKITAAVYEKGGNILSLGTFMGESTENREVLMTVDGVDESELRATLEPLVEEIVDIRPTGQ